MKPLGFAVLLLSLAVSAHAEGAQLRRAEKQMRYPDCKTVTNGTAVELFSIAHSTAQTVDRKFVIIQSMDVVYSTNSVRISSFAATADNQGQPYIGFSPIKLELGSNVKVFVRRPSSMTPATEVCGSQFE